MDDQRYEQIQRDNAEVLHAVESPFRALMFIVKFVLFVIGLIFLLLYNQVGWVVNLGPRSQHAREVRAGELERHLRHYNGEENDDGREWAQYDINFRHQPDPSADLDSWNRFWPDDKSPGSSPSSGTAQRTTTAPKRSPPWNRQSVPPVMASPIASSRSTPT
jgi:hypothetical protein